jgi:hypothetical protein
MAGHRSVIGIAVLCALALSAVVASGASAAAGRAFKCVEVSGGKLFGPHCLAEGDKTNPTAKFGHQEIKNGTATEITATNAKSASETTASSPTTLAVTISGVKIAIVCTTVSGVGSLTNATTGVSGSGKIAATGCTVEEPAGKGCEVTGGTIETSTFTTTTVGRTNNNELEIKAPTGGNFATINIKGCANEAPPANAYPMTGSYIVTARGATLEKVEATITAQKTLKIGGQVAGLNGAITVSTKTGGIPIALT